jgi:hypothetical protein
VSDFFKSLPILHQEEWNSRTRQILQDFMDQVEAKFAAGRVNSGNLTEDLQVTSGSGPVTDWEDVDPSDLACSWTSNTTITAREKRVGDELHVQVTLSFSGTPGPAATNLTIGIPGGRIVADDPNGEYSLIGTAPKVGDGTLRDVSALNSEIPVWGVWLANSTWSLDRVGLYFIDPDGSTTAAIGFGAAEAVTPSSPVALTTGDSLNLKFVVPITGWRRS